jgi:hypothetical protein
MADDEPVGRAKGGKARMNKASPEERSELARKAAAARWSGDIKQATHDSAEHPLKIGGVELPCWVLDDGTRVLSQRGLQRGIGMSTSGGSQGAHRLALFVEALAEKGLDCRDLAVRIRTPILFRPTKGGKPAYGYEATILADLCDVVLAARKLGNVLTPAQKDIADQCEVLVRGFARVGIIALVDEATGYQRDRAADALARILEAFVAKELQAWVPTFSPDFYEQMFRLRGLEFPNGSVRRPQYFGMLTNDVVYKRLAPGVLVELKKATPRNEEGRPTAKYFQSLTSNIGYPKLKEHLGAVIALMKISKNWDGFLGLLDEHYPRYGETPLLPMNYRQEKDDGKGI